MTRSSHNLLLDGVQRILPLGKEKLTRSILRLIPNKVLANELNVSESLVSQWTNQMKGIPTARMYEIIKAGKVYAQQVRSIEDEIDLLMMMQFGRGE